MNRLDFVMENAQDLVNDVEVLFEKAKAPITPVLHDTKTAGISSGSSTPTPLTVGVTTRTTFLLHALRAHQHAQAWLI